MNNHGRFTESDFAALLRQRGLTERNGRVVRSGAPAPSPPPTTKAPKYRNTPVDGFQSTKERDHSLLLEAQERAGQIAELRRQVKFALVVNGIHICDYTADFVWKEGAALVVADTKSVMTRKLPVYRLKYKLMQACHGVQIREL